MENGYINPQGSNVNLTEADILNSYQIARQIEAERVKQQDNTNDLSNFSTNNYTAQKPVDNRSFSSGVKQMLSTGLLKARTSPASNRHLLNQKLLQRGKTKATDVKDPAQKTTSAFARYLPPKTKQTPPSTKELER